MPRVQGERSRLVEGTCAPMSTRRGLRETFLGMSFPIIAEYDFRSLQFDIVWCKNMTNEHQKKI